MLRNQVEATLGFFPQTVSVSFSPQQKISSRQGCQMVYFQTINPSLGKFWRVFQWKVIGLFYGHVFCFVAI
jgi:hypothetical protein